MYLYLGQSVVLPHREILAIFDLDNASWAYKTREFLERAEREGRSVWLTDDLPRSFILAGTVSPLPRSIYLLCPPLPWSAGQSEIPLSDIFFFYYEESREERKESASCPSRLDPSTI